MSLGGREREAADSKALWGTNWTIGHRELRPLTGTADCRRRVGSEGVLQRNGRGALYQPDETVSCLVSRGPGVFRGSGGREMTVG